MSHLRERIQWYAENQGINIIEATESPLSRLSVSKHKMYLLNPTGSNYLTMDRYRVWQTYKEWTDEVKIEKQISVLDHLLEIVRLENEVIDYLGKIFDRPNTRGPWKCMKNARWKKDDEKKDFVCYAWGCNKKTIRVWKRTHLFTDTLEIKRGFNLCLSYTDSLGAKEFTDPLELCDQAIIASRHLNFK